MADMGMVERVGIAARKAAGRYSLSAQSGVPNAQVFLDGKLVFSGPLAECHALISSAVGRAAIEALREPTEDMWRAGVDALWDYAWMTDEFREVWSAMIDAILKEEGNG